jgi:2,3-bisphosphoglycerate-dependent phosphoglycerate mutase
MGVARGGRPNMKQNSAATASRPKLIQIEVKGQPIVFIRHGETTANEQNIYAGMVDVPLTPLGIEQAKQAGKLIEKTGIEFDEVHVSNLVRSKETAAIALEVAGQKNFTLCESVLLAERDFGRYTLCNKNLLQKVCSYETYEKVMHSGSMTREDETYGAETITDTYNRVRHYYENVLLPRANAGKSLLVVCHKYPVEMFALVVAGLTPQEYFDFRLPNGKPMNEREVVYYIKKEKKTLREIATRTTFFSSMLISFGAIIGFLVKGIAKYPLPPNVFLLLTILFLGTSSYFVMLGVNSKQAFLSFKIKPGTIIIWSVKFLCAGTLLFLPIPAIFKTLSVLLLMPPALTTPTLSSLWGGGLYGAVKITLIMSAIAPALFLVLVYLYAGSLHSNSISGFLYLLFFAIVVPSLIAQIYRQRAPISAGKSAERWKFLGVIATTLLAAVSTYYFTQPNIFEYILLKAQGHGDFYLSGLYALAAFFVIKTFSYLATRKEKDRNNSYFVDSYITSSFPNIFLWLGIVTIFTQDLDLGFWACTIFFFWISIDEMLFTRDFKRKFHVSRLPSMNVMGRM